MANKAYNRSAKRERETVNSLRKMGWIAARSAGSKSPIDVYAYHPVLKQLQLIQIKTKKGARGLIETVKWLHSDVVARFIWKSYE